MSVSRLFGLPLSRSIFIYGWPCLSVTLTVKGRMSWWACMREEGKQWGGIVPCVRIDKLDDLSPPMHECLVCVLNQHHLRVNTEMQVR